MLAKKLILASISVMFINTSIYGEEWGRVRCLRECTNVSCADATKKEVCQTNCAQNLDSIDACIKAKPQGPSQGAKPSLPPRRALPLQPQPSAVQSEPNTVEPSTDRASPQLKKQPSAHHLTGAGGKGVTAEQMNALNDGKGVKVKHMKEKIEGLENLIGALQKRIGLLEPLAEHAFGAQELLARLQKNTGFDKPEVRNDPEYDIEYKPEQFSTASSASGTLDGTSCQAVVTKIQQKVKETKDKVKSKKLSIFETQLAEMCKLTKDLNRTPGKKVRDAEAVNRIFGEAKKLF